MARIVDGAASPLFTPLEFPAGLPLKALAKAGLSGQLVAAISHAPAGKCVSWGIPFQIGKVVLLQEKADPVTVPLGPIKAPFLIFLHTSDVRSMERSEDGFVTSPGGRGRLGEHAAEYVILYADGT